MQILTYFDLLTLQTYEERLEYLRQYDKVGETTFDFNRWVNQNLYRSKDWKSIRNRIIARDNGCDLAVEGYEIPDKILIHHLNPITLEDIQSGSESLFDPNNLVCVSHSTHNAIHFGTYSANQNPYKIVVRQPNDTTLWR